MDGPRDCRTDRSQTRKDKCHMIRHVCANLEKATNAVSYKPEVESQMWRTNSWLPADK